MGLVVLFLVFFLGCWLSILFLFVFYWDCDLLYSSEVLDIYGVDNCIWFLWNGGYWSMGGCFLEDIRRKILDC